MSLFRSLLFKSQTSWDFILFFLISSYPWASRKKLQVPTSQHMGSSKSAQAGNNKQSILTGPLAPLELLSLNNFIKIAVVFGFPMPDMYLFIN